MCIVLYIICFSLSFFLFIFNIQQQQQSPTFNNLLNANSFNHIFAPITPPPQLPPIMSNDVLSTSSTTIIDLSTVGENDDDLEIVNVTTGTGHRKRQHSGENTNEHKRNRQLIYKDNQKNVPLKKRGVGNQRDDELNFLNLVTSDSQDSNQAQNLKIASKKDSTACDSTSSSNVSLPKHIYHNLESPKEVIGGNKLICNCFECFPALGSGSGSRPKCVKATRARLTTVNKEVQPSSSLISTSLTSAATIPAIIDAKIDVTLLPGPSGLQKKTLSTMPVKKRSNYYESDDDYDSDEQNPMLPLMPKAPTQADVTDGTLTAPHLQLDWISDENTSQGEEDDDDVIFVSDRSEPIDLTADSDSENDNARVSLLPSSVDDENIENRLTGESINASISSIWPLPINIEAPRSSHLHPGIITNTSNSASQRTPIMSSVELPPRQNSPHVVITMNPRPRPIPTRPINFHDMITGNDVMLYDGSSSQTTRPSVVAENTRATIVLSSQNGISQEPIVSQAHHHHSHQPHHHHHHQTINNGSSSNNNAAHNHTSMNFHHHRRHFYHGAPSPSHAAAAEPNTENGITNDNNNTGSSNQQQQNQNCRQHVGRCPFMTEGHHYNRPRRLPRDYYAINNGRPYAVHEDLWRRQYQEQEIRRQYWSSTFNEPEVQVLRPPPATSHAHTTFTNDSPYVHRLVPLANDGNTPTAVPPNDILNRNIDRLARMQRLRRSQ